MRGILLVLIGCTSGPQTSEKPSVDSGDLSADDSGGEPESDRECSPPLLRLVAEVTSSSLHPADAPVAPPVLGSCGWGLAVLDINEDGWPDLVPGGAWAPTYALMNDGETVYPDGGVLFDGGALPVSNGLAAGDVDGDGRPDLVVARGTGLPDRVYINRGGGEFESTPLDESDEESQGASLFDADNDGDLDLFIPRHIDLNDTSLPALEAGTAQGDRNGFYWNDGGVFSAAEVPGTASAASFQGVPFDADADGDLDLFIVNDFGAFIQSSELMLNEGGTFTPAEDCQCDGAKFGMGAAVGDVDADGIADLHVTNFGLPELLMGMGSARYYESAAARGIEVGTDRVTGWGTSFLDVDMDGDSDLVSAFGPVLVGVEGDWADGVNHEVVAGLDDMAAQPNALWLNDGGMFTESAEALGLVESGVTRSVVVADFNQDGLPDLATSGLNPDRHQVVRVYVSEGGCGPGVVVDFPEMSAADLGARVEWTVEGVDRTTWMAPGTTFSTSGSTLHLGLGVRHRAERVRIIPVGGAAVEYVDVPAGTTLTQRSYQ